MGQKNYFEIPRRTDREVYDRALKAFGDDFKVLTVHWTPFLGAADSGDPTEIIALDTIAVHVFRFDLDDAFQVRFVRSHDDDPNKIRVFDRVDIQHPSNPPNSSRAALLVKRLRDAFEPVDQRLYLDYLSDADRALAASKDESIQKLEKISHSVLETIDKFLVDATVKFQDKSEELERENKSRRGELEAEYQARHAAISDHESALAEKEKSLDLRSNTVARRDLRNDLKTIIQTRSTKSEVTKETKGRRWLVFVAYLALLVTFGFGMFKYDTATIPELLEAVSAAPDPPSDGNTSQPEKQTPDITYKGSVIYWANVIRQTFCGLGFAVTAGFFLRWLNRWAQTHADEEFRLKRLELDVDRASWLVELLYEWKEEKGSPMPSELVRMLGANLFADSPAGDHAMTVADAVGSALFENARTAKLKFGDHELSYSKGGLKQLAKTSLGESADE